MQADAPEPQLMPARHPRYWFEDGNIILRAGNQDFRVHSSVLSRDSVFFRDLFRLPQATSEPDLGMMDGCPVVPLHDVPEDVGTWLSALYDGGRFLRADSPLPFAEVAALIRLSHKYQTEYILEGAVTRLKSCFPHRFEDIAYFIKRRSPFMTFENKDAIAVVNLARLVQINSVLPSALFVCANLSNTLLVFGTPRADGSMEQLSSDDLVLCLTGRDLLRTKAINKYAWLFERPIQLGEDCETRYDCSSALVGIGDYLVTDLSKDAFAEIEPALEDEDICDSCRRMVIETDEMERATIWRGLPMCMGVNTIEDWDE